MTATRPPGWYEERPCDTVLATAVAALAAMQVLIHLDGDVPESRGRTLEIALPGGMIQGRTWQPHPDCDCGAYGTDRPPVGGEAPVTV
jgi:hypothetical protein